MMISVGVTAIMLALIGCKGGQTTEGADASVSAPSVASAAPAPNGLGLNLAKFKTGWGTRVDWYSTKSGNDLSALKLDDVVVVAGSIEDTFSKTLAYGVTLTGIVNKQNGMLQRVTLTHGGDLKSPEYLPAGMTNRIAMSCLVYALTPNDDEMDIKKQLRQNGPEAIREILYKAVHLKPMGHRLPEGIFTQNRRMFQIGG